MGLTHSLRLNPHNLFSVSYLKDELLNGDIPRLEANREIVLRACKTITGATLAILELFFQFFNPFTIL